MAIKKQLKDKDGNTIYPDVGLNLDDVVYSDDPESVGDDYIDPASYSTDEKKTGGTWVAWGVGRVPVGVDTSQTEFDTVEETGGEKTHTLTVNEMPSHTHSGGPESGGFASHATSGSGFADGFVNDNRGEMFRYRLPAKTGDDQAHNNLQPYITCYMYKRTA